jgi:tight adherence protein C
MVRMTIALVAMLTGLGLGTGTWLMWQSARLPKRAMSLRIAPYISDLSADAHHLATNRQQNIGTTWRGRVRRSRIAHVNTGVADLIRRSGSSVESTEWQLRRVLFAAGGALAGLVAGGAYGFTFQSLSPTVGFVVLGGAAGWALPLWSLHRRVRLRARQLEEEMTAALEMLSLCASAGEDLVSALTRVSALGVGPFSVSMRDALAQIALGIPVTTALENCARNAGVPSFTRVVEHLTATVERGTPIADVLAAQIADAREEAKNRLVESAGRNEVMMLIPLVFLILPVTIAFAVFPGLIAIQSGL